MPTISRLQNLAKSAPTALHNRNGVATGKPARASPYLGKPQHLAANEVKSRKFACTSSSDTESVPVPYRFGPQSCGPLHPAANGPLESFGDCSGRAIMSWENPIDSDTERDDSGDLGLAAGSAVSQEDAWAVISSYFEEKGLVRQQLDSFDEFIQNTMQELVDDSRSIRINPEAQYAPGQAKANTDTIYNISFGQIYLSKPTMTEADGSTSVMFPHEARLRNLTYSAPLYVDVVCQKYQAPASGPANLEDMEPYDQVETPKEFIGMVPIMLRSQYCVLTHKTDKELTELNECVYDQGGYFIINGSEKVLIAQERMSNNHVYCFRKNAASKYSWVCETRSHVEHGVRPTSTMYVQMYQKSGGKSAKDKALENMERNCAGIKNHMKINDWTQIQTEFDELVKQLERAKKTLSALPTFYLRTMVALEDFLLEKVKNKAEQKKMSKENSKALIRMKGKIKKQLEPVRKQIDDFRAHPVDSSEDEESESSSSESESSDEDSSDSASSSESDKSSDESESEDESSDDDKSGSDDDSDEDSDASDDSWPSDSSSSSSSSEDDDNMPKGRARWLKQTPVVTKAKKVKGPKVIKQRETRRGSEDEVKKVVVEEELKLTPSQFDRRVKEVVAMRGKKGLDLSEQIGLMRKLANYARRLGPARQIVATMYLVGTSVFDTSSKIDRVMSARHWKQVQADVCTILTLLEKNPEFSLAPLTSEDQADIVRAGREKVTAAQIAAAAAEDAEEDLNFVDTLPQAGKKGTIKVSGDLAAFVDRLTEEYTKSLQQTDPHTSEYVARLYDESLLIDVAERVQKFYVSKNDHQRAAGMALVRAELIYYKHDSVASALFEAQAKRAKFGDPVFLHPACTSSNASKTKEDVLTKEDVVTKEVVVTEDEKVIKDDVVAEEDKVIKDKDKEGKEGKVEKEGDHASALRAAGFKDVVESDGPVDDKRDPSPPGLPRSDAVDAAVKNDVGQNVVSETDDRGAENKSKTAETTNQEAVETTKQDILLDMMPIPKKSIQGKEEDASKDRDDESKNKTEETAKQNILLDMMPIPRKSIAEKVKAAPSAADFVIPKRSVKTGSGLSGPFSDGKPRGGSIPVIIKPLPSPSPEPSPTFSSQPPTQLLRKRTKNCVPVKKSTIASEDRALMRLARKRNSIFLAAAELSALDHSATASPRKAPVRMTGYEVFAIDGKAMSDLVPRLSCPTKREMASKRDTYPAVFFGVSLSAPKAKGESSPAPDNSDDGECEAKRMNCYEELRFDRPEDREFYQKRMYGTTFVPQRLRGWTTLIIRSARFERKSTGIRFNQDRDRDEFAAVLSKRYTFKKSVPRCDIPRENWQKLMRNQPGTVYLHYYNREDAEQASHIFRDDLGNPLELRLEYKAGVMISRSSSPAARIESQDWSRRSGSVEQCAPESSPVSSQAGSARSTPSWRRERQRTPRSDHRYSRFDRGAPSQRSSGDNRYGPSTSGSKRPRALVERRSRSRSRSKSFHGQRHELGTEEPRVGAVAVSIVASTGKSSLSSTNRQEEEFVKSGRESTVAEKVAGRSDAMRGGAGTVVLKETVVPTLPRDQKTAEGDKGQEEGEIESSTTADKDDRREEFQRGRSPPRWQHPRNMQAPYQDRESFPAGPHERSRGNRGFDRRRSRSRSRPRGPRGEDWNAKEGRRPRTFGPGDHGNNGRRRHMHPEDFSRYGGRGYQNEGYHRDRMGGSNSRPH
ncbi:hypothetical protein ON010_g7387 [Phytophthora cinnamomi]|nr:hypothetical protein ON010_g7387 [Phytophthora cinnamomi]